MTLAGEVSSYYEKLNAERAAQRVTGVQALAVEIKDADIAQSAKNLRSWTSSLPADAIKVMVEGGWLTLSACAISWV